MAFRITNRDFGARQSFRPMLGAAQTLSTLSNVTPDSVPPEKVKQIPVSMEEANKARLTYKVSAAALQGWANELSGLDEKTADYDMIVSRAGNRAKNEFDTLVRQVRGRTGDSDVEYALELQWWGLWNQAFEAWEARPSTLEQKGAEIVRFFSDFSSGVKAAWQGYSDWAIRHAGPLLRKYHDALKHMEKLEANLLEAAASGKVSEGELYDQTQSIARGREAMDTVRKVYKTVSSGGDIDKIAIGEFGPVELGGAAIPPLIAAVVAVVGVPIIYAVAAVLSVGIIALTTYFIFKDVKEGAEKAGENLVALFRENPYGTTAMIGFVLGMVALPFALIRSKEVVVMPSAENK